MNNKDIIIKVKGNISKFISKCVNLKLTLHNIVYLDQETILVKINKDDYDKIKKINYFCKISKYKYLGIDSLLLFLKRNRIILLSIICCFLLMYFIEGVIIKVEVIHSNQEIIELVTDELKKTGIKPFTYKKDFNKLESIKNKIVENNPDKIEWMSITRKGMKYVVRVEERIITKEEKSSNYCHIIARKSGIVKKIISESGEILPAVNDYVKKDDILISGEIKLNDEVKNNTCAKGEVYAEVWYTVNLTIPLNHLEKEYTGNKRYNFIINNKKLFKDKYGLYEEVDLKKLEIRNFRIKYIEELEYQNKLSKYSEKEALDKALKEIDEKMKIKLGKDGEVIEKKVLKKSVINSKIEVEVFVEALENIGVSVNYEVEGEDNVTG